MKSGDGDEDADGEMENDMLIRPAAIIRETGVRNSQMLLTWCAMRAPLRPTLRPQLRLQG